jgi:plasmid replication initiation protein
MAIKVKMDAPEWMEFAPTWNGNRDLPKKEQITCLIKYISQEDQDKLTDELIGQQRDGYRSKAPIKWSKAHHSMVNMHVKDIRNVSTVKEDKETFIVNMSELYKIPQLKKLYTEIAEALDVSNQLEEAEVKN